MVLQKCSIPCGIPAAVCRMFPGALGAVIMEREAGPDFCFHSHTEMGDPAEAFEENPLPEHPCISTFVQKAFTSFTVTLFLCFSLPYGEEQCPVFPSFFLHISFTHLHLAMARGMVHPKASDWGFLTLKTPRGRIGRCMRLPYHTVC